MATDDVPPLPILLSRVLGTFTTELEDAAGVGSTVPSLAVWSNLLRCAGDGIDEKALPAAARISSRLGTAAVTGAARRGWITAEPGRSGAKNRHVQLTDLGRDAAQVWPERLAAFDEAWGGTSLRSALEELVDQLEYEHAHYPASYGAADPSAIGGPYAQNMKRKEGIPAHGNDWKPVLRGEGDTVSALPVTALLSQVLMAFTIDYEDRFPWPLANTVTVLCHVGTEARPLADLPEGHGITGNGKSLLERHLIVEVTPDPADKGNKLVALTNRGEQVLTHHPRRLEAVHADWRQRFGDDLITGLRDALGSVELSGTEPDYVIAPLHEG